MRIASVADVKSHFSAYLKASEDGPVIVTRNGAPVAVLLAVEDEEEIEHLVLAYSPRFRSLLDAARQQVRDGQGIRHEEFWEDVESGASERPASPGGEVGRASSARSATRGKRGGRRGSDAV